MHDLQPRMVRSERRESTQVHHAQAAWKSMATSAIFSPEVFGSIRGALIVEFWNALTESEAPEPDVAIAAVSVVDFAADKRIDSNYAHYIVPEPHAFGVVKRRAESTFLFRHESAPVTRSRQLSRLGRKRCVNEQRAE
ncbi:MAG: hypothetical protein ABI881_13140 [Betaproteobacteria bacterium]